MIDCHAHAFPTIRETLDQVSPKAGTLAATLGQALRDRIPSSLWDRARGLLTKTTMDVESVAWLRRRGGVAHKIEPLISMGLLPQMLANCGVADLLASMDRHGLSRTVLIAGAPVAPNAWILEQARAHPGKLVPVVNMPKVRDGATDLDWREALLALADGGARGFKVHLNMDGLSHDHPAYRIAFEVARERNLFVIVHTGCFHAPTYKNLTPAEPALFEPLFRDFPTVRVCLAHMNRDHPERAWGMQKKYAQIFCDTSWQPAANIADAVRAIGADRIVLGSDWPLLHANLQGDVLSLLRAAVSSSLAEKIGHTNALALIDG